MYKSYKFVSIFSGMLTVVTLIIVFLAMQKQTILTVQERIIAYSSGMALLSFLFAFAKETLKAKQRCLILGVAVLFIGMLIFLVSYLI